MATSLKTGDLYCNKCDNKVERVLSTTEIEEKFICVECGEVETAYYPAKKK